MTAVIIGMTNPHSEDPAMALYPHPEGSAGWRLWKMMDAVYPTAKLDYATRFRRINLLTGEWSLPLARKAAGPLLDTIALGDEVVVLGNETWEALASGADHSAGEGRREGYNLLQVPAYQRPQQILQR